MTFSEPFSTAWQLVVLGVLLGVSVLFSRTSARAGVPVFLLFLVIGMLAGSEGPGGLAFEDYGFGFRLGTVALVLILFDGGLNTPLPSLRRAIRPGAVLATVGVLGTASVMAVGARLLGFSWTAAFLLGAVVSSTDAAAVFSVLRGSGLRLKPKVADTLEIESGLNDPMAVLLTMALTGSLADGRPLELSVLFELPLQLAVGGVLGVAIGYAGRFLLRWSRLPAGGLYPVLSLAIAFLGFGLPTLVHGSGFLAVYLAAVVLGNGEIPYRNGLVRFHDTAAWCGQVTMFLVLGLLVFPSRLLEVAWVGLALGLLLAFVARPLVVILSLLPLGFRPREALFVGWVGLRGAVPIILAIFPVLAGVPGAKRLFDVVFFMVVATALVPGATVAWVTRKLGLASGEPPPSQAVLEINSTQLLNGDVISYHVDPALPVAGATIADVPLPPGVSVLLIVRGPELVTPRGDVELRPGDHVHLFCRREDRPLLSLLFGRPES
jgi:cell volume regulation protein A